MAKILFINETITNIQQFFKIIIKLYPSKLILIPKKLFAPASDIIGTGPFCSILNICSLIPITLDYYSKLY